MAFAGLRYRTWKRLAVIGSVAGAGAFTALIGGPELLMMVKTDSALKAHQAAPAQLLAPLPTRQSLMGHLQTEEYDVLVIGGGATGCGVALDAVSRGLKTALVEKYDFSSGTSSKSTKLIHGGVRYLQKAIMQLDVEQYRMVKEALFERANLIDIAPHLAYPFPIMLPVYKWWQLPYYWAGIKMYDLVSGRKILKPSYVMGKSKALEHFPMLKREKLVGALVYYDGQHDDARMCLAITLMAVRMGATCLNHTECIELLKQPSTNSDQPDEVCGARVRDRLTGREFNVKAKCVVNAAGPYTDSIRQMENPKVRQIVQPSSGVHIILPDYYSPANMGLLDPSTSDGRVIFFLPWQKATMAGTTDNPTQLSDFPQPTEGEIQFILNEVKNYLHPDVNVRRGDVLSAWSGIRPLVLNPEKADTQSIARNHIIEVGPNKLITIAGGKWTTYRHMAEETIDKAVKVCGLEAEACATAGLKLDGAHGYTPTMFIRLIQDFGLDMEVAQHLANTYGDKAFKVAKYAQLTGKRWPIVGRRLHEDYPYIEAEVVYAVREYACTAVDVIARRTRLAFLNVHATVESLPRIIDLMGKELTWSKAKKEEEMQNAMQFLRMEMGLDLRDKTKNVPINFTKEEIELYIKRFQSLDTDNKGFVTVNDLRRYFKRIEEEVTEDQIHEMLSEVDLARNGQVDLAEFLQLMKIAAYRRLSLVTCPTQPTQVQALLDNLQTSIYFEDGKSCKYMLCKKAKCVGCKRCSCYCNCGQHKLKSQNTDEDEDE